MSTLTIQNLRKSYKKNIVVKNVSLKIASGQIVGLLGPNGAGKTTTFYMIVGLVKPNGGSIYLDNTEITNYPMYQRAQNGIGYLAQEASVFRKLSVEDNILSVLQLTSLSKKQQKEKMESLLEEFGLNHIRKNRGDLLSGGERRRTEIARALATDPKFVLLDEPFAGVDIATEEMIISLLKDMKEAGKTLVIVHHDLHTAQSYFDHLVLLNTRLIASGPTEEVFTDQILTDTYGGKLTTISKISQELENKEFPIRHK